MSEAVRKLVLEAQCAASYLRVLDFHNRANALLGAIAAVEAELAVPAVTDKQGFDGRSTDYPDWVENYR